MELKIIEDRKNPLLERREVRFQVTHEGKPTPPKYEVAEKLAAKLNAKTELMVIEHYTTQFGKNVSNGICLIYKNEKAMIRAEPTKLVNPKKRLGLKEKAREKEEAKEGEAQAEQKE